MVEHGFRSVESLVPKRGLDGHWLETEDYMRILDLVEDAPGNTDELNCS